jgi:hypothetical protein
VVALISEITQDVTDRGRYVMRRDRDEVRHGGSSGHGAEDGTSACSARSLPQRPVSDLSSAPGYA